MDMGASYRDLLSEVWLDCWVDLCMGTPLMRGQEYD